MLETTITLVGNLVDDPDLRTTSNGASVCTFRLASTPRRFDRTENRWVDGTTLFLRVSCWRQLADNVSASLARGDRALVYGRLRQRSFETSQGERRVTYEIDADAVGTELTWHPARSERLARRPGSTSAPADIPDDLDPVDDQRQELGVMAGVAHTGVGMSVAAGAEHRHPGAPSSGLAPVDHASAGRSPAALSTAAITSGASTPVTVSGPLLAPGRTMEGSRPAPAAENPGWRAFPSSDDLR